MAASRQCRASCHWIARGVMPARKNGQFSGYQAPTCGSARNGMPQYTKGVHCGSLPERSISERWFCALYCTSTASHCMEALGENSGWKQNSRTTAARPRKMERRLARRSQLPEAGGPEGAGTFRPCFLEAMEGLFYCFSLSLVAPKVMDDSPVYL